MEREELLRRYAATADDRLLLAGILDKQKAAAEGFRPAHTAFLDPRRQAVATRMLSAAKATRWLFYGGFASFERKVAVFLPEWMSEEECLLPEHNPVRLFLASFDGRYTLSHRDFLGALTGAGIHRDSVGDIRVEPSRAVFAVLATVAPHILEQLGSAGKAKLKISEIAESDIAEREPEYRVLRDTVRSMRLDSLAAAGFSLSREKASALVRSGLVTLNYESCVKPDKILSEGDIVSAKGYGKFMVSTAGGTTRKGRTAVELKKYV